MAQGRSVTAVEPGKQNPALRYDFTPNEDAEPTGEFWDVAGTKREIYRRPRTKYRTTPVLDGEGKEIWEVNPVTGHRVKRLTRNVVDTVEMRECVQIPMPDGRVAWNFDFRPSPDEADRKARKARREQGVDRLLDALDTLEAKGLTAEDLVAAARGLDEDEPDSATDLPAWPDFVKQESGKGLSMQQIGEKYRSLKEGG